MELAEMRIAAAIKSILARYTKGKLFVLAKQLGRVGVGMWSGVKMLEAWEGP
jgi:hypothetical protein